MRLRAVIHAGEVHYDGKGFFGEDLDVAFRLLDAPRFKAYLGTRRYHWPLWHPTTSTSRSSSMATMASTAREFIPIVNVNVGYQRRKGWVQLPRAGRFSVAVSTQAQAC